MSIASGKEGDGFPLPFATCVPSFSSFSQDFYKQYFMLFEESQKTMSYHVFFCEIHRLILYQNRLLLQDLDLRFLGDKTGGKNLQEGG